NTILNVRGIVIFRFDSDSGFILMLNRFMFLHFLSFGIIRFYIFGHLVTDENAIKPFPLIVEVNIEPLNLDEMRYYSDLFPSLPSRYLITSIAALQPDPAAVTACL